MINFDDISYEEFDDNILNNIHIKQDDILLSNQNINLWDNNEWTNFCFNYDNLIIDKIQLSDNTTGNPYGKYNDIFKKIPEGEIIFSIKRYWCWFKYNKNLKIK